MSNTFKIPANETNQFELLYPSWIPKLHKNPYKQRYIAGSSKYKIMRAVKKQLYTYISEVV